MLDFQTIALLLGSSWASGINLYLTTAGLGIAHRVGWIALPGAMEIYSHPAIIAIAVALYAVEFFADKIPYVDSTWDSIHTFIRPVGGLALGYMAMTDASPVAQYGIAMVTGSIALDAHLTKATSRLAINASPEPVTNTVASVTEDISVLAMLIMILKNPIVVTVFVILFILFSIWFLKKMFKFLKKVFQRKKK